MRSRVILVITKSNKRLVIYKDEGYKWIHENYAKQNGNFQHFFNLVENDKDRVIFVNNLNPDEEDDGTGSKITIEFEILYTIFLKKQEQIVIRGSKILNFGS